MVKLTSVRESRLYGPGHTRHVFEYINAAAYVCATIFLLAGFILLLPEFNNHAALIVLIVALVLIILVNLHDLYAQVAGVDYKLYLLAYDPQLAFIEVASPLVQIVGGILFLTGAILLLQTNSETKLGPQFPNPTDNRENAALRCFIAGAIFWLLGSIHNACQGYERASLRVQAFQKAVSIPFLIASTLFLLSGVLIIQSHSFPEDKKAKSTAAALAIAACALFVVAAIVNMVRVGVMHGQGGFLERLRGGAQERLDHEREHRTPFLERNIKREADPEAESSVSFPYKEAVIR